MFTRGMLQGTSKTDIFMQHKQKRKEINNPAKSMEIAIKKQPRNSAGEEKEMKMGILSV